MTKTRLVADSANDNSINGSRITDGSITNDQISSSADIDASKVSYDSGETSAQVQSVGQRLTTEVWVTDFGAVEGDLVDNASINTDAFTAALSTGHLVRVPAGIFWVNQIDVTSFGRYYITGDSIRTTTIKRNLGEATFYSTTSTVANISNLNLTGNGTGSLVRCTGGGDAKDHRFNKILFQTDDYGIWHDFLSVDAQITDCEFGGLNETAVLMTDGAYALRVQNSYFRFVGKGIEVRRGSPQGTIENTVFAHCDLGAIILHCDVAGQLFSDWMLRGLWFESNCKIASSPSPVILLKRSEGRIRNIEIDSCYFNNQEDHVTYMLELDGVGIQNVSFTNTTFKDSSVPVTNDNSVDVSYLGKNYFFNSYGGQFGANAVQSSNPVSLLSSRDRCILGVNSSIDSDATTLVGSNMGITGAESGECYIGANGTTKIYASALGRVRSSGQLSVAPQTGPDSDGLIMDCPASRVNVGQTFAYDLPEMLGDDATAAQQRVYLVSYGLSNSVGGPTSSEAATAIVTMFGPNTTGILVTPLSSKIVGTDPSATITRIDPGGSAPHQIQISTNNAGLVKSFSSILLSKI